MAMNKAITKQWQRQQGMQFKHLQKYKVRGQKANEDPNYVVQHSSSHNLTGKQQINTQNGKHFVLEVRNILSMYNAQEQDKIAMVKNWLSRKGLHYLESLTKA